MISKIPRLALGKILPTLLAASAGLNCYALFMFGVSPAERAATLEEIDRKQVNLIIASDEVMSNEKYEPLKAYINRTFKTATHFGDVLILER